MNRLNRLMAMVLLALWLPATSWCFLEGAGWISRDECCASKSETTPPKAPSEGSPCCTLASGSYKVDDNQRVTFTAAAIAIALLADISEVPPLFEASATLARTGIPPDFPVPWQFFCRTALSPRAPSLVS